MDNDDKEFETFLEQFELRHQRPFPQENPVEAGQGCSGGFWLRLR